MLSILVVGGKDSVGKRMRDSMARESRGKAEGSRGSDTELLDKELIAL